MLHQRQRDVTIPHVVPNAGLQAYYRKRLQGMIEAMADSIAWWVSQAYRRKPPVMAQDETPADALRRVIRKLERRWTRNFDELARKLSPQFVARNGRLSDRQFMEHLKKAGFSIEFQMTPAMRDIARATVAENVSLIRSIPRQHFTQVEGMVMRSVQAGRDLGTLSQDLQHQFGVTKRRAALIARDQNNKATSSFNRARQQELGIEEAIWRHSHAGKTPRPTHVDMDGKVYKVDEGMWDEDEGRYVWPGQLIGCRCTSKSLIRGFM
jgi:SPP1 gp7 family putative phage head morphogenesis protein